MSDQLHYLSISELSKLIETKVISPVEVTKLLLDRIDAIDPELKSYAIERPHRQGQNKSI